MKNKKHVNAGLKSPADLAVRLEAGEEFWLGGDRIHYDTTMISPFRAGSSALVTSWQRLDEMTTLVDCEWWEDIPGHGVLCWVSDVSEEHARRGTVRFIVAKNSACGFVDVGGFHWEIAIPLTPEEAKKYILGMDE